MCTYSSLDNETNYMVWFNRDELKSRAKAEPPKINFIDEVKMIAPRDPVGNGTWIFVNEYGVTAALLNHYQAVYKKTPKLSRGKLLWDLASVTSTEELGQRLKAQQRYQSCAPFHMVIKEGEEKQEKWEWDGASLSYQNEPTNNWYTSSSYNFDEVKKMRNKTRNQILTSELSSVKLEEFHRSSVQQNSCAYSVMMDRPDAQTWSLAHITVTKEDVTFTYEAFELNHVGNAKKSKVSLDRIFP